MKTKQFNMDSKVVDYIDVGTQSKGTKPVDNFPLSFLDFLNSKTVDKTMSKNIYDHEQFKDLTTKGGLKNDEKTAFSSLVDKDISATNICDNDQSKGLMTRGCLEKDKKNTSISVVDNETFDLDDLTLSDNEDFLPTYKSLFERIKRHSSQDSLFKCSPGSATSDSKPKSTLDENGISAGQNIEINNCESDVDDETKTRHNDVSPAKFESMNTTEVSRSVLELELKTVTYDDQSENQRVEQYATESKVSLNKVKQLVEPPVEQPTSLVMPVASHDLQSNGGRNERQEASETPPEINLADLQRICYKAMIFEQTGQVPVDCNADTSESYSSCEEHDPTPKNPLPCLCRFYCKKKCKKDSAKLSSKGPCRVGKGYPRGKRNQRNSSCACKILPNSKVANRVFQTGVGESSNANSARFIEESNTTDTRLRNQKRAGKKAEPNAGEESAKIYLDDLMAKTKLLSKLELSEKKLKLLANYDASLPSFSGMVPVDEDGIQDASVLCLSDDDSVDEQKENIADLPQMDLGPVIDLTADSPPKSPIVSGSHHFNIAKPKLEIGIKSDPEGEMPLTTNKICKPTVGRYGVARGAIYISDSNDDADMSDDTGKERERNRMVTKSSRKLLKEPLKNARQSIYICDSDEDSIPNMLFATSVLTTSQSTEAPKTSESDANDGVDASKKHTLYHPVTSGLKDHLPATFTDTDDVSTSVLNDSASTSHSVLDWETPSANCGTTYADLLASYAAYDPDDDHMSFTMGSPGNPECLDDEDPVQPIKDETAEPEHEAFVLKVDDVVTSQPSTSAVPVIALHSNRVLRTRTTPRITQTMMFAKRSVKREVSNPTRPQTSVNNSSASAQSISKQRGRPTKKSCPQQLSFAVVDNAVKKAKVAVAMRSVNESDESTPERTQLKKEITAMASQLKKVSALAARAAELEKVALDAKHKELLAVQKAQQASEKLEQERLERMKLMKETEEKNQVEKAEKERKAKELEKEKERAASEARARSWECPVCFEPRSSRTQLSVTPCGHVFCKTCILEVVHSNGHCPLCNQVFIEAQVTPLFFNFSF